MEALASRCHALDDIGAAIASGTFKTEGMVVVPCSMKTVAGIAHGYSQNLLLRAADVVIKERRKLVLVARESPLSTIHLNNMLLLANAGIVILPPVLTYYHRPATIQEMTAHIVGKVLDVFGIELRGFQALGSKPGTLRHRTPKSHGQASAVGLCRTTINPFSPDLKERTTAALRLADHVVSRKIHRQERLARLFPVPGRGYVQPLYLLAPLLRRLP